MAIQFGGVSLQQRVIEKVQDQINQEASPTDIEKFKTQMGDKTHDGVKAYLGKEENLSASEATKVSPIRGGQESLMQDNRTWQADSVVDSIGKVGDSFYKAPGDRILETLLETSRGVKQIDSIASTETTRD